MVALDSEKRKEMLPAGKIIKAVDLPEEANIADIGCGAGYLTIPLARKIRPLTFSGRTVMNSPKNLLPASIFTGCYSNVKSE